MFRLRDAVTASALVVILVGTAAGALIGVILGDFVGSDVTLAIISSVLALLAALIFRRYSIGRLVSDPDPIGLPRVLLVNGILSSLIGGLAAYELSVIMLNPLPSPLIGSLSGLLAAILMTMLMVAYHSAHKHL